MRPWWLALCALWLHFAVAAAVDFPNLSGRVVDVAGLLSAADTADLTTRLEQHEAETSNQIVVVTIADLQGYAIADYANRLGRHWGIGQQNLDNGVLLVVAPGERKVRIEVGYGLEGALTDALSSDIIRRQILPSFREDDYPAGIQKGIDSIVSAIAGEYEPQPVKSGNKLNGATALPFIIFIGVMQLLSFFGSKDLGPSAFPAGFAGIFATAISGHIWLGVAAALAVFILMFVFYKPGSRRGSAVHTDRSEHRHHHSGRHRGGGFSGGGGSFGGGGASGSW